MTLASSAAAVAAADGGSGSSGAADAHLHSSTSCSSSLAAAEQTLTCSLCRCVLRDARILPSCLHSFCFACLQNFAGQRIKFPCPLCKTVRERGREGGSS